MPKEPKEPIVLTADDVVAAPPALIRAGIDMLPAAITAAGPRTSERFIEFFTANIRNRNTRMAGRRGARSQVRGKARQDSGSVGRPGPATVGLHRRDRTQRTPRSRAHRRHGLQLRPR